MPTAFSRSKQDACDAERLSLRVNPVLPEAELKPQPRGTRSQRRRPTDSSNAVLCPSVSYGGRSCVPLPAGKVRTLRLLCDPDQLKIESRARLTVHGPNARPARRIGRRSSSKSMVKAGLCPRRDRRIRLSSDRKSSSSTRPARHDYAPFRF